jgi:hypothetical protein
MRMQPVHMALIATLAVVAGLLLAARADASSPRPVAQTCLKNIDASSPRTSIRNPLYQPKDV